MGSPDVGSPDTTSPDDPESSAEDASDGAGLRYEYISGADRARQREILLEASSINDKLRAVVDGKQSRLATMMGELTKKSARYASRLKEPE
jgi:hypothetical protein